MGNLDSFVFSVIGGINTIYDRLRAVDCEVAVEFNHRVPWVDQVGPVHLDFIVVLSTGEGCREDNRQQDQPEKRSAPKIVPHRCHAKFGAYWPVKLATFHEEDYQLHHEFSVANK